MDRKEIFHRVDHTLLYPTTTWEQIRTLCDSEKTRSNDQLLNLVMGEFERGEIPEIPDVALDMHTARGQRMGRDLQHFLTEASQVQPPWTGEEPDYLTRLLDALPQEKE